MICSACLWKKALGSLKIKLHLFFLVLTFSGQVACVGHLIVRVWPDVVEDDTLDTLDEVFDDNDDSLEPDLLLNLPDDLTPTISGNQRN